MSPHTQDDAFHEIQLNGKQLVFLFMAATVVSVVIFLCGVLVGRGVRAERSMVAQTAALEQTPAPDPVATQAVVSSAVQPGADPTAAAAPPEPVDDLSYFDRLEKRGAATADDLRPEKPKAPAPQPEKDSKASAVKDTKPELARDIRPEPSKDVRTDPSKSIKPDPIPAKDSKREPVKKPAPPPAQMQAAAPPAVAEMPAPQATATSGSSDGYAVQVAAVNARSDADAIVKRLTTKGYTAYVQVPPSGTGSVFRVRIGTFKTRHEADVVAAQLQKDEQIKPWVTR